VNYNNPLVKYLKLLFSSLMTIKSKLTEISNHQLVKQDKHSLITTNNMVELLSHKPLHINVSDTVILKQNKL